MADKPLTRIENKLDHVVENISAINVTLARQEEQLAYHIKRTDLLEADLKPVKNHVAMVNGALKFIGLVGVVAGIAEVFLKFLGH